MVKYTTQESLTDWRGNVIKPGDTVLYPRGVYSHSVEVAEAIVIEIRYQKLYDWSERDEMITKVQVQPLRGSRSEDRLAKIKPVLIETIKNITKLSDG